MFLNSNCLPAKGLGVARIFAVSVAISAAPVAEAATVTVDTFTNASVNDFGTGIGTSENVTLLAGETRSFVLGGVNVTYTNASNGASSYEALGATQLWDNGVWGGAALDNGYVSAFNGAMRNISFAFDTGVSQIGALVNYVERSDITSGAKLEIFDISGNSLEVFDLLAEAPIATPGVPPQNHYGEFRGFARDEADIFRFEFTASNGTATNNIVLDNLTLSTHVEPVAPVPLPAGLPMLLLGLGALATTRWRARRTV